MEIIYQHQNRKYAIIYSAKHTLQVIDVISFKNFTEAKRACRDNFKANRIELVTPISEDKALVNYVKRPNGKNFLNCWR